MFNGYTPVYSSYSGGIYEKELIRAVIHATANLSSKLQMRVIGGKEETYRHRVNPWMTTSQFLYRLVTILLVENTAFIVPIEDGYGEISGYFPVLPGTAQMVESGGKQYLRFRFGDGHTAAIEWERVGVLTRCQYRSDIFGETNNDTLAPTLQMIEAQNEGIRNGVKNSASIRFIGRISNILKSEDIEKARAAFVAQNLTLSNNGGVILTDQKITDITPIKSDPFTVPADQIAEIKANVFDYFGCNEKIIQNNYTEDEWNAFYEGAIEPIAIQLSQVMSCMTFTPEELAAGAEIRFTADWLDYASNTTKKAVITELFDRGFITINEGRKIMNMSRINDPYADEFFIRREYASVKDIKDTKEEGEDHAGQEQ